jgi:hypothetical protein
MRSYLHKRQRFHGSFGLISLFGTKFAASEISFPEILGCGLSGGRNNSEPARCFWLFLAVFSRTITAAVKMAQSPRPVSLTRSRKIPHGSSGITNVAFCQFDNLRISPEAPGPSA